MKADDKKNIQDFMYAAEKLFHTTSMYKEEITTEVIRKMTTEHRTNQQLFFKNFVFPLLSYYANTGSYDLRNEATVNFCKSIAQQIESHQGFPFI